MSRDRPIYRVIFLLIVAPLGAAVVIAALLLFGAAPRIVFYPGHTMRALLQRAGIDAPNAVGVLTTVIVWWAIIAVIGLLWERRRRHQSVGL
jgi:hypothetical protein